MSVREDDIQRPSGAKGIYGVIDKPHFAIVIPYDGSHLYLVEQYRYPVQARCLEFPQGTWEGQSQIDPLTLAKGELKEETGLSADTMQHVAFQHLAPGMTSQCYDIYLATGLSQGERALDVEEEDLVTHRVLQSDFEQMILDNKIKDATSVNAYLLAKFHGLFSAAV